MTDAHLKALFAEDQPPARDPAFSAAVMAAGVRRRFLWDVARLSGVRTGATALVRTIASLSAQSMVWLTL